jgi:hypothetical protein
MSPLIIGTASQGSDMWNPVPVSLPISLQNCPTLEMEAIVQYPLDVQTTPAGAELPVPTNDSFFRDLQGASKSQKSTKDLILDAIDVAVDGAAASSEGSPKPSNAAIAAIAKLLAVVPDSVLGEPDVDLYYGEIHLEWVRDTRRVVLMGFSKDKQPLVHNYEKAKGKPSKHGTEKATAISLEKWLRWLNA